jgi:hypothetical protein
MIGNRHQLVYFQSDFYRDCYHHVLHFLLFEVAVILCLILSIGYVLFKEPPATYYASTSEGKVIPIVAPGRT